MGPIVLLHILAGVASLVAGFVALGATKGGGLHRRSGRVFVAAMLPMALLGALVAAVRGGAGSVVAGLLTAYLVFTALTTVRPAASGRRVLERSVAIAALALGAAALAVGFRTLVAPIRGEVPAAIFFAFGTVALVSALADLRLARTGPLQGPARLKRHLRRMTFALWIASASFFLGQADELPDALRQPVLLAVPVLAPLLAMALWLWRLRARRSSRPVEAERPATT